MLLGVFGSKLFRRVACWEFIRHTMQPLVPLGRNLRCIELRVGVPHNAITSIYNVFEVQLVITAAQSNTTQSDSIRDNIVLNRIQHMAKLYGIEKRCEGRSTEGKTENVTPTRQRKGGCSSPSVARTHYQTYRHQPACQEDTQAHGF
jgi:hypothetical protein